MNRNIKIVIGGTILLILALALFFFVTKNQSSLIPSITNNSANNGSQQSTQNILPSSQLPAKNSDSSNQTNSSQNQAATDSNNSSSLSAKKTNDPEILDKYGKYAFETFQKYPAIISQIRALDQSFATSQMDPSYPSHVYQSDDGKNFLLLGGCTEHDCAGTKIIVLYNITDNKVYMGKEDNTQSQLQFLGNPGNQEKDTMTSFYLQK